MGRKVICTAIAVIVGLLPGSVLALRAIRGYTQWDQRRQKEEDKAKLLFVEREMANGNIRVERPEEFRLEADVEFACSWDPRGEADRPKDYVNYASSTDILEALLAWLRQQEFHRYKDQEVWHKLHPELVEVDLSLLRTDYYDDLPDDIDRHIKEAGELRYRGRKVKLWREGKTIKAKAVSRPGEERPYEAAWMTTGATTGAINESDRHIFFKKKRIRLEIRMKASYALRLP